MLSLKVKMASNYESDFPRPKERVYSKHFPSPAPVFHGLLKWWLSFPKLYDSSVWFPPTQFPWILQNIIKISIMPVLCFSLDPGVAPASTPGSHVQCGYQTPCFRYPFGWTRHGALPSSASCLLPPACLEGHLGPHSLGFRNLQPQRIWCYLMKWPLCSGDVVEKPGEEGDRKMSHREVIQPRERDLPF